MGTNTVLMSLRQTHPQLVKAAMLLADLPDTQMLTENKNHRSGDCRAEPSELGRAHIHDHLAGRRGAEDTAAEDLTQPQRQP